MARNRATVHVTGMNRDMAKGAFDPRFTFENMNIRVTARDESCTAFAVTNEKGTRLMGAEVKGMPIGVFSCDKYFGIFSYDSSKDYITVYELRGDEAEVYFRWSGTGLDFKSVDSGSRAIETEVSVEAGNSVRVYWVDGTHQPRVFDFKRLRERFGKDVTDGDSVTADYFGFLPVVREVGGFEVHKESAGHFYSGTVQFVVTEVVNGNESNIAYYSPLYYASDDANERGYKPDNTSSGCSFRLRFDCADYKLIDYFVVYAIHRVTQDGVPVATRVEVSAGKSNTAVMTGLEEAADASHLLFLNRQAMTGAKTIAQKDGVLFVGGWDGDPADKVREVDGVDVRCVGGRDGGRGVPLASLSNIGVTGVSQLRYSSFDIGHFKKDEGYMLGYQVMDKYGRWGQPKLLKNRGKDLFTMTEAPYVAGIEARLPNFEATIEEPGAVMIRPVVAYLDESQKPALYQGIVTPTIYCEKERVDGTCYAKLSPFARSFRNYAGGFEPRKLWANPPRVSTAQGSKKIAADVYLNYRQGDVVCSFEGFDYTAEDAGVTEKTSMQYGTYPASQHLQALGTTKDYNNELQTSWRYRDVVFKTSLIPLGEGGVSAPTQSATHVKAITVNLDVLVQCSFYGKDQSFLSAWEEKFYVGVSGGQYKMLYGREEYAIKKEIGDTLMDGGEPMVKLIHKILWEDGGGVFSPTGLFVVKEGDKFVQGQRYDNGFVTFSDMKGGNLSATCLYESGVSHGEEMAVSRFDDKKKEYKDYFEGDNGKLRQVFGSYTTSSATDVADNAADVFTIDNTAYFVDAETLTMHSPDFTDSTDINKEGGTMRVVGAARMGGFISDTSIVANTAKLGSNTKGFAGFQNKRPNNDKSGRCAMALPNWSSHWDDMVADRAELWSVPPYGVDDYLALVNNNKTIENKVDSKLTYHQLANFRFCDVTRYYPAADTEACDGIKMMSGSTLGLINRDLVYKAAESTSIIPSLAYFWSNGPYYSAMTTRRRGEKGGIKSIGKFQNEYPGKHWPQLGYAVHWLWENHLADSLNINMVPLMDQMSTVNKNRGEWIHGGTVDDATIEVSGVKITGGGQSRDKAPFESRYMNDYAGQEIKLNSGITSDAGHDGFMDEDDDPDTYTMDLKYSSTPHVVIKRSTPMWNYGYLAKYAVGKCRMFGSSGWRKGNNIEELTPVDTSGWRTDVKTPAGMTADDDCLWVVDIVNNDAEPQANPATAQWLIAGEAVTAQGGRAHIKWVQGDWYFQRYDCLRTYPESVQDKSQVVEIVSFMCETRRNICGRYDSHGGKAFLQANPQNYGLINDSYTQKNNFFSYAMAGENDNVETSYPCTVTWSLPKTLNTNIDSWTSISGSNILDLEGDKGPIVRLARLGNTLFCFQPSGISMVLYNERTPISTQGGTPVELGMSGKVDGKVYIANSAGALHNFNIVGTDSAIYFMDAYNKRLCSLGEGVRPLSEELGFHSWAASMLAPEGIRMLHDRRNSCVMAIDDSQALVYSEKLGSFESFMSYEGTRHVINVQDKTILVHGSALWEMNGGEYNMFFGEAKDYWVDMLVGGGPTDKVFDNVELRGDLLGEAGELRPKRCPFNTIRAYNEYQDSGETPLKFNQFSLSALKNRFRSWHAFVPRNSERRMGKLPERMRNPWCHVVLLMRQPEDGEPETGRAQIQDLNVDYTE